MFSDVAQWFFSLTLFDYVVLCYSCFLGFMGIFRGLIGEVLKISGVVISFVGTFFLAPFLYPWVFKVVPYEGLSYGIAVCIVFCSLFIGALFITPAIKTFVRPQGFLGPIDHFFGFFFGAFKAFFILCFVYLGMAFFFPFHEHIESIKFSWSLPWIERGALCYRFLSPYLQRFFFPFSPGG